MLHEAFDAPRPGAVAIAHALGDFRLNVEGQAVFRPSGQIMQMAAHGPQKLLSLDETGGSLFADDVQLHQILDPDHAVLIAGNPEQQMQVAQPALAFLDIGFQHIAHIAHAFVALIALHQFGFEKFLSGPHHHILVKLLDQIVVQRLIPPQPAHFQQGGADGDVFLGVADALFGGTGGLPHLQSQIPQHIQQPFHQLLVPGGALVRGQKQQIHVRLRTKLAPSVTAHRHQGHGFRRSAHPLRQFIGDGEIESQANQLIDQETGLAVRGGTVALGLETALDFGAALGQGHLENLHQGGAARRFGQVLGNQSLQFGGHPATVDNGPLIVNVRHGHPISAFSSYNRSNACLAVKSSGFTPCRRSATGSGFSDARGTVRVLAA